MRRTRIKGVLNIPQRRKPGTSENVESKIVEVNKPETVETPPDATSNLNNSNDVYKKETSLDEINCTPKTTTPAEGQSAKVEKKVSLMININ